MSRLTLDLPEDRILVFGDDPPFNTYFMQMFDAVPYRDDPGAQPLHAAGYHPAEQSLEPGPDYGPYPLTMSSLDSEMERWGLSDDVRDKVGRMLAASGAPLR